MNLHFQALQSATRREFLTDATRFSLGAIALRALTGHAAAAVADNPLAPKKAPLPTKAKAVIYLSMSGAPPSLDMFDWKPKLKEHHMQDCPAELMQGEKFAFIKGTPKLLGSPW